MLYYKHSLAFLFIIATYFMPLPYLSSSANAQFCALNICKSAPGANDTVFTINIDQLIDEMLVKPSGIVTPVELSDSECFEYGSGFSGMLVVTEIPTQNWTLADVVCENVNGITINDIPEGIEVNCVGPNTGSATCTFVNELVTRNIPTLSEWGLIAMAGILGMFGLFAAIRSRKVTA